MNDRLVIVTGASGAVGNSFVEHFLQEDNTNCVAVSRSPMETEALHCQADLLDRKSVEREISKLDLANIDDVILIHGVGKFKYESEWEKKSPATTEAEIDEEVFSSNYHTFVNIAEPIIKKLNQEHKKGSKTTLALCGFGSITDKYKIPFWRSYTYAKDTLREYIKKLAKSKEWRGLIRGRFINVSTTDTGNENKLRPYATAEDKKYWLKPEKIVKNSIVSLGNLTPLWQEIDIYEPLPGFKPHEYYTNHQQIQTKWQRQTGIS
ncbi:MAG: SDR family NAD(P)-dependent oxidoreductase [Moorea sp. SIO2B7]|nr:SDR family NAD(P)-dependent oxidoreductase [Moorena sp. SIO2B7]